MGVGKRCDRREARQMILVRNLRLDIGQSSDRLKVKAARELKLPTWAIKDVKITKRSLDARRKMIYTGSARLR